ncbi:hypothetical protein AVEN_212953-1 [Araneus ventricosus]|uniref:Uncharacterized protein n=1 Tax=Araneus ventricosus TaxID=182803 RepID=A0A4Y2Q7C3_ARAVE|nr:hypothetical protein AVEN_231726-1 [Araneus ventricosus]GBN59459.1 hypothetical protein AVEN_161822-1 [Araneus ventricosus]GBN59464.1 hypothetical protein AVEN_175680-1 [Araneus ventricosus]GBN59472.1 hypothetical protein AVEN_212953-1 [Araneus ventricosus]
MRPISVTGVEQIRSRRRAESACDSSLSACRRHLRNAAAQEPFQVLEQMLIAGCKIWSTSGMVKRLAAEPLQQLLCAQRHIRA